IEPPTADGPGDGLRPDQVDEGRLAGGAAIFHVRLTGPLRQAAEAGPWSGEVVHAEVLAPPITF
ncbi:hypothetical protein VB636_06270, partial [Paracoccus sp. APAP_BH8]